MGGFVFFIDREFGSQNYRQREIRVKHYNA